MVNDDIRCEMAIAVLQAARDGEDLDLAPACKTNIWGTDGVWPNRYFVTTVGIDEGMIKAYIGRYRLNDWNL